ncbi:MAG: two-component system response regulator AtoC [Myxococcota bacterium]|jgi:two-component system response regulator AtoC
MGAVALSAHHGWARQQLTRWQHTNLATVQTRLLTKGYEPLNSDAMPLVAVIEDDPLCTRLVERHLSAVGIRVAVFHSAADAQGRLGGISPDAFLLDIGLPDADGMSVLKSLRQSHPDAPVLMLTARNSISTVVQAMRAGAFDYFTKPTDWERLVTATRGATDLGRQLTRMSGLTRPQTTEFHGILGDSRGMRRLYERMRRVAPTDLSVLIGGESGSGKELVAQGIHQVGPRKDRPFVAINCASIPESLQESELFGHDRGAFTGAHERRVGRFEEANGGTLFLDEVAELSLGLQAKLLRVLQERSFSRVGGTKTIHSDFRLLAATHTDLSERVADGRFREDLYYRLAVFELMVPPLRERGSDILVLAQAFLTRHAREHNTKVPTLTAEVARRLAAFEWPGNVRQLQNTMKYATVMATDATIRLNEGFV